jgi:hypothetical protein
MHKPSIYIYIMFALVIITIIKRGYLKNGLRETCQEIKKRPLNLVAVFFAMIITIFIIDLPLIKLISAIKIPFFKEYLVE